MSIKSSSHFDRRGADARRDLALVASTRPKSDSATSSGAAVKRLEVVVDGYVLDLTDFVNHHPGTKAKILAKRARGKDITHNFLDHFSHTTATFRAAARAFDKQGTPVSFTFRETPSAPVRILGRLPK